MNPKAKKIKAIIYFYTVANNKKIFTIFLSWNIIANNLKVK